MSGRTSPTTWTWALPKSKQPSS